MLDVGVVGRIIVMKSERQAVRTIQRYSKTKLCTCKPYLVAPIAPAYCKQNMFYGDWEEERVIALFLSQSEQYYPDNKQDDS